MKKIFISYGAKDHYGVSETQRENPERDKSFSSYTNLMAYFRGNAPEAKRLRTREVQVVATGISDEQIRSLEKDLLASGFKKLKGVIRE